jgi:ribosome-associated protein
VHLRFDVRRSSLPEAVKERLLAHPDQRVSAEGVVVIKAQSARSQEKNKADALARLQDLIDEAAHVPKARRPTKPTFGSKQRRLQSKTAAGKIKALRAKVSE